MIPRLFAAIAVILYLVAGHFPANAQKIRAASGGLSIIHSLLWAPYEQKLMKKYGVDLEYIAIESGTVGMQTLVLDGLARRQCQSRRRGYHHRRRRFEFYPG